MFAITADQRASRTGPDLVDSALDLVVAVAGDRLALPPERTAGDELQAVSSSGRAALDIALALIRDGRWSVGIGIGALEQPSGPSTRSLRGSALINARAAVEAAKREPSRLVVITDPGARPGDVVLQPLLGLLVDLRARRSAAGWELYDLLVAGRTQADAAVTLGISAQAASKRARAGGVRLDLDAQDALGALLDTAGANA